MTNLRTLLSNMDYRFHSGRMYNYGNFKGGISAYTVRFVKQRNTKAGTVTDFQIGEKLNDHEYVNFRCTSFADLTVARWRQGEDQENRLD